MAAMHTGKQSHVSHMQGEILIAVLILLAVGVVMGGAYFATINYHVFSSVRELNTEKALSLADAGVNRALYELGRDWNWSSIGETVLGEGSYEVAVVSTVGSQKTIESIGYLPNKSTARARRKIRVILERTVAIPQFNYGVQVGEGGLEMQNNSRVQGSVYANGPVTGQSGGSGGSNCSGPACVDGTVISATRLASAVNQSWETQNIDYTAGALSNQLDLAQSFQIPVATTVDYVSFFIRKVSSPSNATVRIVTDDNGSPSKRSQDVLVTGTLASAKVTTSYAWQEVHFLSPPSLNANTPYWLMIDTSLNAANYYVWGGDTSDGYSNGTAKRSADWTAGSWTALNDDLDFRIYTGGGLGSVTDIISAGGVRAHFIKSSNVSGNVQGIVFDNDNGTASGTVSAEIVANCDITGNVFYNVKQDCTISGTETTPVTPPADPALLPMPISSDTIAQWKQDAEAGGTITGNYSPPNSTTTPLGPKKITGDLLLSGNDQTLKVTGTVWVQGNIDIDNGSTVILDPSFGALSGVMMADGWIHIRNNSQFRGSGQSSSSYIMILTTKDCKGSSPTGCTHHSSAMDLHNNATGAIFYSADGLTYLHQNITVTELVGWKIHIENNSIVVYESGLTTAQFSSGPSGGLKIVAGTWQIIE